MLATAPCRTQAFPPGLTDMREQNVSCISSALDQVRQGNWSCARDRAAKASK
jgi:hypothetical protein